jgi:hypothetical protein
VRTTVKADQKKAWQIHAGGCGEYRRAAGSMGRHNVARVPLRDWQRTLIAAVRLLLHGQLR